jgi:hypothetical protein
VHGIGFADDAGEVDELECSVAGDDGGGVASADRGVGAVPVGYSWPGSAVLALVAGLMLVAA